MWSPGIVLLGEDLEICKPFVVAAVVALVGPFAKQGLDDALGFAVGLGPVRACALEGDAVLLSDTAEQVER